MDEESIRRDGRHAILELSPLELDCMKALWRRGEASVREVQEALVLIRPRAYTTIMTILDRLARKGVVTRRKSGKAWVYSANLSAADARAHALEQVLAGFFDGSPEALSAHLEALGGSLLGEPRSEMVPARIAAARSSAAPRVQPVVQPVVQPEVKPVVQPKLPAEPPVERGNPERLDTSLL